MVRHQRSPKTVRCRVFGHEDCVRQATSPRVPAVQMFSAAKQARRCRCCLQRACLHMITSRSFASSDACVSVCVGVAAVLRGGASTSQYAPVWRWRLACGQAAHMTLLPKAPQFTLHAGISALLQPQLAAGTPVAMHLYLSHEPHWYGRPVLQAPELLLGDTRMHYKDTVHINAKEIEQVRSCRVHYLNRAAMQQLAVFLAMRCIA